jgi:hypothetical protein
MRSGKAILPLLLCELSVVLLYLIWYDTGTTLHARKESTSYNNFDGPFGGTFGMWEDNIRMNICFVS